MSYSVIKFSSKTCPPCVLIAPIFDKLKSEFKNVKFISVDIDKEPDKASDMDIRSIPTICILKSEEEIERMSGYMSEIQLRNWLNKFIK